MLQHVLQLRQHYAHFTSQNKKSAIKNNGFIRNFLQIKSLINSH